MNERRRFLTVLGATATALALPACGESVATDEGAGGSGSSGTGGSDGTTGAGGATGTGASTGATTSSSAASGSSSSGATCADKPAGSAVGTPADYVKTGLHAVPNKQCNELTQVLIGRDAKGLYALSSLCTHQFCDLNCRGVFSSKGVECNCHGSMFDTVGAVTRGPANRPLEAFAMELGCDGQLYVDTSKKVANTQRLVA